MRYCFVVEAPSKEEALAKLLRDPELYMEAIETLSSLTLALN